MTTRKTKSGITVTYTNTYNGMLEQGGRSGRTVTILWGTWPSLTPKTDLTDTSVDPNGNTILDIIRNLAMGRWTGNKRLHIVRRGTLIR